jgi:RNA polymerase sigma-70 factor (ECF subfamily)
VERILSARSWPEVATTVRRQMATIVGQNPDLDDLAQAALERLVRSAGRFEGRADFATYAYRTCLNVARNHHRWFQRHARPLESLTHERAAPDPDVLEELVAAERRKRVCKVLERMRPERRTVLLLSDVDELPASRISSIVGCPESTVRSRLRAARADLAAALRRDPSFDAPGTRHRGGVLLALAVLLVALVAAAYAYSTHDHRSGVTAGVERISALHGDPKHVVAPTKVAVAEAPDEAPTAAAAVDLRREFRIAEDELARGEIDAARARLSRVAEGPNSRATRSSFSCGAPPSPRAVASCSRAT